MKFAIQPKYSGREFFAIVQSGTEYYFGKPKNENDVPLGSVEWIENIIGRRSPDYYPIYLAEYLHREVGYMKYWPLDKRLFIKPADSYKRFTGFVTNGKRSKSKQGPFVWSTPVKFVQEWRYYVANGQVLTTGWYAGANEDEEAPELPMELPSKVYGAFDFGRLSTGESALVEYQHPFACGWYGDSKDHSKYLQWLVEGWKWLTKETKCKI